MRISSIYFVLQPINNSTSHSIHKKNCIPSERSVLHIFFPLIFLKKNHAFCCSALAYWFLFFIFCAFLPVLRVLSLFCRVVATVRLGPGFSIIYFGRLPPGKTKRTFCRSNRHGNVLRDTNNLLAIRYSTDVVNKMLNNIAWKSAQRSFFSRIFGLIRGNGLRNTRTCCRTHLPANLLDPITLFAIDCCCRHFTVCCKTIFFFRFSIEHGNKLGLVFFFI